MEDRKEKEKVRKTQVASFLDLCKELCCGFRKHSKNAPWLSVPQFGDWDHKGPVPDYSLDFSKIREMRKQNKRDVSRASLGNEEELIASNTGNVGAVHNEPHYHQTPHSPTTRRSIFSCFNCCVKA